MAIRLVDWRGCMVSADMVAPLNEAVKAVPQRVTPIPGYGSYRNNAASGGTDNGSGHVDIYMGDGWTDADRERFILKAREVGFEAFYRPKSWYSAARKRTITATWGRHGHLVLKDSADLSDGALAQLKQWYAGSNGLAGFWAYGEFMYDPDPHPRTHLRQTWSQYLALKASGPGTELGNTVKPPSTPAPPPVPEEDNMADWTEEALRALVRSEVERVPNIRIKHPQVDYKANPDARLIPLSEIWWADNIKSGEARAAAQAALKAIGEDRETFAAQIVAGVVAKINATTGALTTTQIQEATEAGVRAALGSLDN